MIRLFLAAALAALPFSAHAQAVREAPYTYQPLGYCQITSLSSAVNMVSASCSTGSVPSDATIMQVCVSTQGIRYRDDGGSPTASVGMPVASGTCFQYSGNIAAFKMIYQSSGAVVDASFYN